MLNTYQSLNQLLDQSAREYAALPAAGFAFERPMTYAEFHQKVLLVAAGLKNHGVKKNDRVAILAENSPHWGLAYWGIIRLGAVAVPVLPDFPESDVKHILNDCKAKIIFTNKRQLEKLYEFKGKKLKEIITLDDASDPGQLLRTKSLADLLTEAADLPVRKRELGDDLAGRDDIASIIYTSGTSGHSKAVMLSHGNFLSNVESTLSILGSQPKDHWTFLSILPMSHAYEFTISFLTPLLCGARIVYAGRTPTPTILERICRQEQPTVMCMVPMIMEKIYKKKVLPALHSNAVLKAAVRVPFLRKKILRKIGKKLQLFFGGKLKIAAIGGAALNIEVEKFLAESNFPYIAGYGLTEASPLVSAGPYGDTTIPLGSSGKLVKNVSVTVTNVNPETGIGEVLVKGPNVMTGYCDNPEATAETIDEQGWLHTGDLGYLDKDNNLFIKGRSKSVIVLSHGENIYPETIEEKINAYQHVIESLVHEKNDRLEAQVYLDYELIDQETQGKTQQHKLTYIEELLLTIKWEVNQTLPQFSQLAQVVERQDPFIKTATHKIKRYLYVGRD